MSWQKGPLPPNTYNWGGVVLVGQEGQGFYFADFCGDHVKTCPDNKRVEANQVARYDNHLELPPDCPEVVGRAGAVKEGD